MGGVGLRASHNLIHDHPHCAILFGGNEHLLELNEIHHIALETGDVGAIYTGRDWTFRGNRIRHNFIHHTGGVGMGSMGVYMDDCVSGTEVFGNVFYKVHWAMFLGGGRDHRVENNVFVECDPAVRVDGRGLDKSPVWSNMVNDYMKKQLAAVPQDLYRSRYPAIKDLDRYYAAAGGVPPEGNLVARNVCAGKWLEVGWHAKEQWLKLQDNFVGGDPRFVAPDKMDFRLKKDSPAWAIGFQPIPFEKIGLKNDEYRKDVAAKYPAGEKGAIPDAQVGSLYPFLQATAGRSTQELSFLHDRFTDVAAWKREARPKVLSLLQYAPPKCDPRAEVVERVDCGEYVREKLYFNTTPDVRVPAYLLLPKGEPKRRPAIVALHDHGGFFAWGKEKIIATDGEHPALTEFKRAYYSGRSFATELAKRGYVVIAIDMFYWGERRMLLPRDPPTWLDREKMSLEDVAAFHRRSSASTSLIATGLFEAGITWSGVMFTDDIRTVDYLATRPEVDPERIGCCGLSVGGFRSAHLAGLDARIKAAVVVGWMSTYGSMLQNKLTSIGFMKVVPGLYKSMDLPDVVSMTAPGGLMVIHGTKDQLFPPDGVDASFDKIAAVYKKAGVSERFQGVTYEGPHEFNARMQDKAFAWLDRWLKP